MLTKGKITFGDLIATPQIKKTDFGQEKKESSQTQVRIQI